MLIDSFFRYRFTCPIMYSVNIFFSIECTIYCAMTYSLETCRNLSVSSITHLRRHDRDLLMI